MRLLSSMIRTYFIFLQFTDIKSDETFHYSYPIQDEQEIIVPNNMSRQGKGFLFIVKEDNFISSGKLDLHLVEESSKIVCPIDFQKILSTKYFERKFDIDWFSPLDSDSALILVTENIKYDDQNSTKYLRICVVQISSCKTVMSNLEDINYEIQFKGLIIYGNKVDVVLENHPDCGDIKICKITHNNLGDLEDVIENFSIHGDKFFALPAEYESLQKGYFAVSLIQGNSNDKKVIYVNELNNEKVLSVFPQNVWHPSNLRSLSNQYNFFTFCSTSGDRVYNIDCSQYDLKLDKIMNHSETTHANVANVAVANSASGGFRLMINYCHAIVTKGCRDFTILKVDSQGDIVRKTYKQLDFFCDQSRYLEIETEIVDYGEKVCIYLKCEETRYVMTFANFYSECFPSNDV
ncbi:hypothetical protein QAD02_009575 [Eretmocerus hayati]|uniref:Uncharacterized protein n=1 Tax=Eretmocerus hayati TaxID=131215 RepID=A0ACC2NA30_9HYME|nr:hypothetical protein QAD02_009575 [Eretmocerus hayati]